MADDKQIIRELNESEKWLGEICPKDVTDSDLDLDRLKQHVRLSVQETWLARQLESNDHTPKNLTASISDRIKQQLAQTDIRKAPKHHQINRWRIRSWQLGVLATAAVIGLVAVGLNLYYPATTEDSYVLLDSLFEDSPFSNDIDTSLAMLADEFDDLSWTLQNSDQSIDDDISYTYDQFDAADAGDTFFDSVIES